MTEGWLEEREPRAPEALFRRLLEGLAQVPDSEAEGPMGAATPERFVASGSVARVEALAELAREELSRAFPAESGGGRRDREHAYALLAADAWLTYACEAALELDDPEEGFVRAIDLVASLAEPERR